MSSIFLPFFLLFKCVICLTTDVIETQVEAEFFPDEFSTTSRPIIGILTQKTFGKMSKHGPSFFLATYVKFVEMGGARVVPVKINQTEDYYQHLFKRINGLLLPGGGQDLLHSGFANAARYFFKMAMLSGSYFPIWGTCMGFEELLVLTAGENILDNCYGTENVALPVDFYQHPNNSKLFKNAPKEVIQTLEHENITANFHHKCLWVETFLKQSPSFQDFFNILTTSIDDKSNRFISAIESKVFPFYGLQFHPEKNVFAWDPRFIGVKHTESAIKVAQYFANFFVLEAKKNDHKFENMEEETRSLIYNYTPDYIGKLDHSVFEQAYFFNV